MAEIKERPILFSAPMVNAILDGRKTVTRRIMKTLPKSREGMGAHRIALCPYGGGFSFQDERGNCHSCDGSISSPYGKPSDRLWVRETWALEDCGADGERVIWQADRQAAWRSRLAERFFLPSDYAPSRWRPSIHMPRWASRLSLDIVSVRAERLHDITETDAAAEGVEPIGNPFGEDGQYWRCYRTNCEGRGERECGGVPSALESFETVWDEINGDRAPWKSNPWVWRVEFKRAEEA